jgi:lambda family phage minor tail protein L
MRTLSTAALIEKNKLSTDSAWLILLEVTIGATVLKLVANNEDILWSGDTWQAFPFELDTVGETGKGEIPAITVKVSNVTGEVQRLLEANDGANGVPVVIRVINTDVTTTTPELELSFVVESSTHDEQWITFRLTGANCLTRRVPRRRYLKNFCPFVYGGIECGVSAATMATYPTCNRTSANCTERGNFTRFGGFPWMPEL